MPRTIAHDTPQRTIRSPCPQAESRTGAEAVGGLLRRAAIGAVRAYQLIISPMVRQFLGPGPRCRFHPTCSNYAIACFREHPFHRALYLSVRRLLKCHPFHDGGYDPVPPAAQTGCCHDRSHP